MMTGILDNQNLFAMKSFVFFALFYLVVCQESDVELRIRNGIRVPIEKIPYQVFMKIHAHTWNTTSIFNCGGSIISNRHILTAAHCITCLPIDYITIKMGITNSLDTKGALQNVDPENIYIHEKYCSKINSKVHTRDIGLIKLPVKLQFSEVIKTISLPSEFTTPLMLEGRMAVVSGWGVTEYREASIILQAALKKIEPQSFCNQFLVPDDHLCVNISDHMATCMGDSGGPLVIADILYGVSSFNSGFKKITDNQTCQEYDQSAYTSVIYYLDWIKEKTGLLPGTEAKPQELPYFVRLTSYFKVLNKTKKDVWSVNCAGTLISDRHVLTTAHCVKHKELDCAFANYVQSRFGISSLLDIRGVNIKVLPTNIVVHEKFKCQQSPDFDIAVIRVPSIKKFKMPIKPIPIELPSKPTRIKSLQGKFSSFGSTHLGVPPKLLRIHKIDFSHLCDGYSLCGTTTQLSICNIDPGAPINVTSTLIGMISKESLKPQDQEECQPSNISMIVNIMVHLNWIKKQIQIK